jgi:hypothetical protein
VRLAIAHLDNADQVGIMDGNARRVYGLAGAAPSPAAEDAC